MKWFVMCGLVLLISGCEVTPLASPPPPRERTVLRERALDLLRRAARSEQIEASCHAMEALVNVAPDEGLPFFRAALQSEYPLVRFAGLTALGTLRDGRSLPAFRQALRDPSPLIQIAAAYALVRCGEERSAGVLFDKLMHHPDAAVRAEAAHLIGLLDEPRARMRLRAALELPANTRTAPVHIAILTALARIGDEQAGEQLIIYTQGDSLSRLIALQSLTEVSVPAARDALALRVTEEEPYVMHQLLAARALAQLGEYDDLALGLQNLRYRGDNPNDPQEAYRVRTNAALLLGEIGDPRALPRLRDLAENSEDPRLQVAAAYAICRIVAPEGP